MKIPLKFDDFVGNKEAVEKVQLLTYEAEKDNFVRIPDFAFLGPSGHGKNTLANIIANELNREIVEINSTVIRSPLQFRSYITSGDYQNGVIIHLDECHALPRKIQDNLLSVLEHPRVLHTSYKDQTFKDSLPGNMSFILSTTHAGALRKALMSRLKAVEFLEYTRDELLKMAIKYLMRQHDLKKDDLDPSAVVEIANRARSGRDVIGFCDDAVRLAKRENGNSKLDKDLIVRTFEILGIDENGLTRQDRKILQYMNEFNSFVGLDTLEAIMNMTKKEIKSNLEPYLLRRGFIRRQSAGRIITKSGKKAISK